MKRFVVFLSLLALGYAAPEGRIVGGEDAIHGQLPYTANLNIGSSYNCGAAIISERYALTALKCVCSKGSNRPWPPQLFTVSAGTNNLYRGGQEIKVEKITIDPNYSNLTTGIALLKLVKPFVFNANVNAIRLATKEPPNGATVEISGWGRTQATDTTMHQTLQLNEGNVVPLQQCRNALNDNQTYKQAICLNSPRKNGLCRGDYGGLAVYEDTLVGLAALAMSECGSLLPDLLISIPANWIVLEIYCIYVYFFIAITALYGAALRLLTNFN